jgi:hypothetical protein
MMCIVCQNWREIKKTLGLKRFATWLSVIYLVCEICPFLGRPHKLYFAVGPFDNFGTNNSNNFSKKSQRTFPHQFELFDQQPRVAGANLL